MSSNKTSQLQKKKKEKNQVKQVHFQPEEGAILIYFLDAKRERKEQFPVPVF